MTSEDREVRQFLKWKREQERVAAKKELAKLNLKPELNPLISTDGR